MASLMLIAQAVFLLECGHTYTDAANHPTQSMATTVVTRNCRGCRRGYVQRPSVSSMVCTCAVMKLHRHVRENQTLYQSILVDD